MEKAALRISSGQSL
jgi:hypothetical protein